MEARDRTATGEETGTRGRLTRAALASEEDTEVAAADVEDAVAEEETLVSRGIIGMMRW